MHCLWRVWIDVGLTHPRLLLLSAPVDSQPMFFDRHRARASLGTDSLAFQGAAIRLPRSLVPVLDMGARVRIPHTQARICIMSSSALPPPFFLTPPGATIQFHRPSDESPSSTNVTRCFIFSLRPEICRFPHADSRTWTWTYLNSTDHRYDQNFKPIFTSIQQKNIIAPPEKSERFPPFLTHFAQLCNVSRRRRSRFEQQEMPPGRFAP
ncbi:hypothetical protein L249_2759 [Ophiocordyceps polyrhachis-furcata BCC 54312]|uniref:Uncharacterized protein n=1 Tax=Ophiocordyceps polyrhachis-furcata BCC 54312 TaxID=1330021 RepID=A0A367LMZ2_9HYPO|nr:hypothetical protein L249_2759 [Ophiocordyceps polyrhachis-furcata BCC 54312]